MKEEIRLCYTCGGILPSSKNGNSKFCDKACYGHNKAKIAKLKGQKIAMERVLLKNEEIVTDLYQTYGSMYYFSAKLLIERDFNWSIYSSEVTVNGLLAKKLIAHGYTLFTNQNVQLWKF
jgi:hypothetical protein